MPTIGKTQKPAGVKKNIDKPILTKRTMVSRDKNIKSGLAIDNCPYNGNAVINANK